mgnify:CR=1 FL=1
MPADDRAPGGEGDGFRTLPEIVAEQLRARILLGDFPPGANIPERETSAELGVSRTPLREALRILASEGLVVIRPARSPVVANPSMQEILDLFAVMRVLEGLAGELVCLHAEDEHFAEIAARHAVLRALSAQEEPVTFFNADMAFHQAIVDAASNPALAKTHREYNSRLWRARFLTARVMTERDRIIREHGEILAALQARDTAWATAMLNAHLRSANRKIEELYAEKAALF